jgi:cell division protein FtsL
MNAAARAINQANIFTGHWGEVRLSFQWIVVIGLFISVLFSSMAVVYVTNSHRVLFSQYETLTQQSNLLELQWGQLLLEQASLATTARVEQIAEVKLGMTLPLDKQVVLIKLNEQ